MIDQAKRQAVSARKALENIQRVEDVGLNGNSPNYPGTPRVNNRHRNAKNDMHVSYRELYKWTTHLVHVRGRPVFHSEAVSEFCQLRPQTPSAFLWLWPPPSSGDASKDFLFRAPSSSPQHYHVLLPFQLLTWHPLRRLLREFHLLRR